MSSPLRMYAGYLFSSVLAVMLALPIAGLVGAVAVLGSEWLGSGQVPGLGEIGMLLLLVAFFAVMAGGLVALLVGAPLYALLASQGWARWWNVLLLALLPVLVLWWRDPASGGLFLLFGGITALLTHLFHRHTRLGRLAAVIARRKPGQPQ